MSSINWVGNKVLDPTTVSTIRRTVPAEPSGTSLTEPGGSIQGPPPSTEPGFIPNYLTKNIGKNVRAEFIIGTSQYADKTGKLVEVGINYFVLEDVNSRTLVMCDLYSVKFVTILED